MTPKEIKVDGNSIQIGNKICYCIDKDLIDYITSLKQDLEKANGIIEKDRQFYKCRMDEYAELKKENEKLYMFIYEFILRLEHIRDNGSKRYIKENLDLVIKYMNEKFKEYYNLKELKESGNNE